MMLRLHDNPPILWPRVESLAELPGRWWVAHTRSRAEKAFAWDLVRLNVGYFLPMVLRTRVSGRRKRTALLPLFRGYVFFCGTEENRYQAMRTDRLCRTISAADQRHLIAELCHLHRGLQGKADLDPYPHAAIGRRCRVRAGPFRGLEGVVVERSRRTLLVLQVGILGQGAAMEIDCDLVEPAD